MIKRGLVFCQIHLIVIESAVSHLATIAWLWTNLSLKGLLAIMRKNKKSKAFHFSSLKTKRWTETQSFSSFWKTNLFICSLRPCPSCCFSSSRYQRPKCSPPSRWQATLRKCSTLLSPPPHKLINHVWLDYLITCINSQSWVKQTSFLIN